MIDAVCSLCTHSLTKESLPAIHLVEPPATEPALRHHLARVPCESLWIDKAIFTPEGTFLCRGLDQVVFRSQSKHDAVLVLFFLLGAAFFNQLVD